MPMSIPISCKANICLFHCNAFCLHFFNSLEMSLVVHISEAVLMKAGYKVRLLKDCLAYVDYDGHIKALDEMSKEGIIIE